MDPDMVREQNEEERQSLLANMKAVSHRSEAIAAHVSQAPGNQPVETEKVPPFVSPTETPLGKPALPMRKKLGLFRRLLALKVWAGIGCALGAAAVVAYTERVGIPMDKARILIVGAAIYGGLSGAWVRMRCGF